MTRIPDFHVMHVPGADPVRDELVAQMKTDHPGDVIVHEDPDRNGVLPTWIAALKAARDSGDDWNLVVQDDAVPMNGWSLHLPQVLKHAPAPIISLSHFSDRGMRLVRQGVPFALSRHGLWGQAVAYHRSVLPNLVKVAEAVQEYAHEEGKPLFLKWDDRIPAIHNMLTNGYSCFTARALFSHLHTDSLIGHASKVHRHPQSTIENQDGPEWSAKPRYKLTRPNINDNMRLLYSVLSEKELGLE